MSLALWLAAPCGRRGQSSDASAAAVDSGALPGDDPSAAEAAKAVAGDAGADQDRRRVTTAGGIRGIILSIKDDAIMIRVAPDNIKLEVAKSAIASVTTQDGTSGS